MKTNKLALLFLAASLLIIVIKTTQTDYSNDENTSENQYHISQNTANSTNSNIGIIDVGNRMDY
jgi:hypothetical protein